MADFSISPEVAARIEKLERESRTLRRVSFVTTLALVAVTAIGAAAVGAGTVTSKPFTIVDASGHARVKLDALGLHVFDAKGRERLSAIVNQYNQPAFRLADPAGLVRFRAYITPGNDPSIKFEDGKNQDRMWLDLSSMDFYDAAGKDRLIVGMTDQDPAPIIRFLSASDKPMLSLEAGNAAFIRLFDGTGTKRGYFGMYDDGSSGAQFWNASGSSTWSAP